MGGTASTLWSRETIFHALSGAIASATSVSVFYPLETVRTRKQASRVAVNDEKPSRPILLGLIRSLRRIYSQEGVRGRLFIDAPRTLVWPNILANDRRQGKAQPTSP